MQSPHSTAGNGLLISTLTKVAICLAALYACCAARAATDTWINTGGKQWLSGANWSSGSAPGIDDVAEFDANPAQSGSSHGLGVAFASGTENNPNNFTGANGSGYDEETGAISMTSLFTQTSLFFGNTGTTSFTVGYMTFNGDTVGGIANTILSDMSTTANMHIQNEVNSGVGTFGVVLGNTTNVVQSSAGTSSSNGVNVEIISSIDQVNSGSSITFLGGGTGTINGGVMELGGTNSFTGGITAGQSDGTQGGTVQIDTSAAIPATGGIVVNTNSDLLLDTSGTFGAPGQSLTLNGPGTVANSGALQIAGGGKTVTWQGNVTLGSNSYISASNAAGSLTLTGTVNDGGFTLQKQGAGNLILSGDNIMTGSTVMGNGTLTVNAGSSMGTGSLVMDAGNANNTAVTLNNGAQTIGNLSSSPSSSGTETQIITLNSTVLTINETGTTTYGLGSGNSAQTPETSTITGNGSVILGAASSGILKFTGTQSYTGGTRINGGTLQINTAISLPSTGSVVVSNGGALLINGFGANGALGQSLTLNGAGNANESGALVAGSSGVIWQGNVSLGSNTTIDATSGNDLTLSGTFFDNGCQLQKQGGGDLILSGNSNVMTGSTRVGNGTLTVDSGSTMGTGDLQMGQTSTNITALELYDAAQSIGNLSSTFSSTSSTTAGTYTQSITLNSTALTINETGTTTYGNAIVSDTISQTSTITGNGSVILSAASTGALTLTGTHTYTGGTQIKGGTLLVNGSLSGNTATVNNTGGELAGAGVIGGLVTVSGGATITAGGVPGSIGALTLQSGLNLSGGGTYGWVLGTETDNSTGTAGVDFDQLVLTGGPLTLGGASKLLLYFLTNSPNSDDAFWQTDHSWTIISASGATGTGNFSSILDPTFSDGTFSTVADGSGDVTLEYQAQAVPEPSTWVSLGIGAAVSLFAGRRRRDRQSPDWHLPKIG